MHAAGLQGRGWVVLAVDPKASENIRLFVLDSHDLGPVFGYVPLLVVDVFEHAYWMDFGTNKGTYLKNLYGYIHWGEVNRRYKEVHPIQGSTSVYSYNRRK